MCKIYVHSCFFHNDVALCSISVDYFALDAQYISVLIFPVTRLYWASDAQLGFGQFPITTPHDWMWKMYS